MTARRYGPVEIIDAGIRDAREAFADLYVELDRVRAASAWVWHRAFVDSGVPLLDGAERLPCHPAPPGFGRQELERLPSPIALDRLTDDGLVLYSVGVRLAVAERAALEQALEKASRELDALRAIPDRATRQKLAAMRARMAETIGIATAPISTTPISWPDVPVRIPGTDRYLAPGNERGDHPSIPR